MSKRSSVLLVLSAFPLLTGCSAVRPGTGAKALRIAEKGRSRFQIVVSRDGSPSTQHAAKELQGFLKEMTGAELPIVDDGTPMGEHEIILGKNARLRRLGIEVDFKTLGNEGYVIRTAGPHLVIAGGDLRGNLYAVYGLLGDHLGCRWFTPSVSRIPKCDRLEIPPIDETRVPALEYRDAFVRDCFDPDWSARNRVNARGEERHGGKVTYHGFVHTFYWYIPPDKHFDEHPEYFSEVDGKRARGGAQLCMTNEGVTRLMIEKVRQAMRERPEATIFSVSQNDCGGYCQCADCRAIAEREESQMGPLLHFVNRVAEALEDEFPNNAVDTLAYQWSRKPPKHARPRRNVIIRLCSIECCFSHPLATCDSGQNRAFVRDIQEWAKICDRLWVWDYTTSFANYLTPFPNRHVLDANIRFFVENSVTGIFEEDVYDTLNSEMASLDGYMMAKFLWDPNYGRDRAEKEFLEGVYGAAAPYIRKYLDLLERRVLEHNIHMGIAENPGTAVLTDELLEEADNLWDQAEAALAYRSEELERVRTARLTVDYAVIERANTGGSGGWIPDYENLVLKPNLALRARMQRFFERLEKAGVTRLREGGMAPEEYRKGCERLLGNERQLTLVEPASTGKLQPGLKYASYEGNCVSAAEGASAKLLRSGVAKTIDVGLRGGDVGFSLLFSGHIEVPKDGIYTFAMTSDDGGYLSVAGQEIVSNRHSLHWGIQKQAFVALKAGRHPIEVAWFNMYGLCELKALYSSPKGGLEEIPASALWHEPEER